MVKEVPRTCKCRQRMYRTATKIWRCRRCDDHMSACKERDETNERCGCRVR